MCLTPTITVIKNGISSIEINTFCIFPYCSRHSLFFLLCRPTVFPFIYFFYAYIYILSDGDVRHNIIVFPKLLFLHFNETSLHIYIFFLIAKQI